MEPDNISKPVSTIYIRIDNKIDSFFGNKVDDGTIFYVTGNSEYVDKCFNRIIHNRDGVESFYAVDRSIVISIHEIGMLPYISRLIIHLGKCRGRIRFEFHTHLELQYEYVDLYLQSTRRYRILEIETDNEEIVLRSAIVIRKSSIEVLQYDLMIDDDKKLFNAVHFISTGLETAIVSKIIINTIGKFKLPSESLSEVVMIERMLDNDSISEILINPKLHCECKHVEELFKKSVILRSRLEDNHGIRKIQICSFIYTQGHHLPSKDDYHGRLDYYRRNKEYLGIVLENDGISIDDTIKIYLPILRYEIELLTDYRKELQRAIMSMSVTYESIVNEARKQLDKVDQRLYAELMHEGARIEDIFGPI